MSFLYACVFKLYKPPIIKKSLYLILLHEYGISNWCENVAPSLFQILVVIEPLLIDEDYYARVEGREIISNLAKVLRFLREESFSVDGDYLM